MKKRQIINIINFIRGAEPRVEMDLVEPVREQILLMKELGLRGTFLIQYDALCDQRFTKLLCDLNPDQFEIGAWFEIVQPLVEKVGLVWRGRHSWDWHAHCGFSVGYTKKEREILIDCYFEEFKLCFGYYPKTFGSWAFDAHTLDYASKKYGLHAACNCKDQWGTDGYTLWGGYYGQGYYPSRKNSFCPAQKEENQIGTPVFRMLGSDPVYQYDLGLDSNVTGGVGVQGVVTLEPVYTAASGGGGVKEWVDWYLRENFNGNCLTFGYAQAGQENSFGWDSMKDGLFYQFHKISDLISQGEIEVETLSDTGLWFKSVFSHTPPSTITALTDWKDSGKQSIWYNCKNYRINFYTEEGRFWIRDLYLFREDYKERYLDDICTTNELIYDNLPIIDGNRFCGNGIRSGLYPCTGEASSVPGLSYIGMTYKEERDLAVITFYGTPCGDIVFTLSEKGVHVENTGDSDLCFIYRFDPLAQGLPDTKLTSEKEIFFTHREYTYNLYLSKGFVKENTIFSEGNEIQMILA
ncbi:MAG: hypothetical protein K0S47_2871 [Herbinix sp.]|jgi:hypothetical protein|nr:hypothetical protein [Herbinix sp.]